MYDLSPKRAQDHGKFRGHTTAQQNLRGWKADRHLDSTASQRAGLAFVPFPFRTTDSPAFSCNAGSERGPTRRALRQRAATTKSRGDGTHRRWIFTSPPLGPANSIPCLLMHAGPERHTAMLAQPNPADTCLHWDAGTGQTEHAGQLRDRDDQSLLLDPQVGHTVYTTDSGIIGPSQTPMPTKRRQSEPGYTAAHTLLCWSLDRLQWL